MGNPTTISNFPAPVSPRDSVAESTSQKTAPAAADDDLRNETLEESAAADDDGWHMTEEEEDAATLRLAEQVRKEGGMLPQEESDKFFADFRRRLGDED